MAKIALITGATSGIGEALCKALADQHVKLIITGRDEVRLQTLTEELQKKVSVTSLVADLNDETERKKIVNEIKEQNPDLLINNAGFGLYGEALQQDTEEMLEMVSVNCSAVVQFTMEAAKALHSKGKSGTIMNISSAAAFLTFPFFALYAATKSFVVRFSQSLDEEMRSHGIRVLVSCPGMVKTSFRKRAAKRAQVNYSPRSMEVKEAVDTILWQITKGKQMHVFNWKVRFAIHLGKWFIPKKILMKKLKKSIKEIY